MTDETCTCGFQHLAPHLKATCTCEGDEMANEDGCRPTEENINNVLAALGADPWLTSALPDGGDGAEIEDRATGTVMPWEVIHRFSAGWRDASDLSARRFFMPGHEWPTGWRWVTRPASEASEQETSEPEGLTNTGPDESPWREDEQADPNWGRVCLMCSAAIRAGGRHLHECPNAWRLGSREELIAKVETMGAEAAQYEAAALSTAQDLSKHVEKLAADLAETRRVRDEAQRLNGSLTNDLSMRTMELAKAVGTDRCTWRGALKSVKALAKHHDEAEAELAAERGHNAAADVWKDHIDSLRAALAAEKAAHAETHRRLAEVDRDLVAIRGNHDAVSRVLDGKPQDVVPGTIPGRASDLCREHAGTVEANEDLQAEVERLTAESAAHRKRAEGLEVLVEETATVVGDNLYAGRGHNHWDHTMQRGAGCELCISGRAAVKATREALERAKEALALATQGDGPGEG